MKKNRIILYFLPLLVAFCMVGLVIYDLKHIRIIRYQCHVLAVGRSATPYQTSRNTLYTNHAPEPYNIAFTCPVIGTVFMNDYELMKRSIARGDKTQIVHKIYEHLPNAWSIEVQTAHSL